MTALAYNSALDPALDFFDDDHVLAPQRPQLRLIEGQGRGHTGRNHVSLGVIGPKLQSVGVSASVEAYRRRRFFALLAVTVLVLGIAWAAGVSVLSFGTATASAADAAPAVHVVLPGDSYAAIAADLGVTNAVEAGALLRASNGGGDLVVGQRLVVDLASLTTASLNAAG